MEGTENQTMLKTDLNVGQMSEAGTTSQLFRFNIDVGDVVAERVLSSSSFDIVPEKRNGVGVEESMCFSLF